MLRPFLHVLLGYTGHHSPLNQQVLGSVFCELACSWVGLDFIDYGFFDQLCVCLVEVKLLVSDCTKAWQKLGWLLATTVGKLVKMRSDHDLYIVKRAKALRDAGYNISIDSGHDQ